MTHNPFPSFDPLPPAPLEEQDSYKAGYQAGFESGKEAMGLYIPHIIDAVEKLTGQQADYQKKLRRTLTSIIESLVQNLVMPLPIQTAICKERAQELVKKVPLSSNITVSAHNIDALSSHVSSSVTLKQDESLPPTDVIVSWGENQVYATSEQEELNKRLIKWFEETIELAVQGTNETPELGERHE